MKPRRAVPVLGVIVLTLAAFWYYNSQSVDEVGPLTASGTIEARNVRIASEVAGRVDEVYFDEGDRVEGGDTLVKLDTSLLSSQLAQAEAALESTRAGHVAALSGLEAAQAAAVAAHANYALAKAGPSDEQIALAQTTVDKAGIPVEALQEAYDEMAEAVRETKQGKDLKQQLDLALTTLANATAQYELLLTGSRPEQLEALEAQAQVASAQVEVARAQVDATLGQVTAAEAAVDILKVQVNKLTIKAPSKGIVLSRSIEPGEIATPGSVLLVIGGLDELNLIVYLPEDRYGSVQLGDRGMVFVDSYPEKSYPATIVQIADRAEFTPRNVQTEEGRRTTVFAVKLLMTNDNLELKPGMTADVVFEAGLEE